MKVLDLFCGVGGASHGYFLAGATHITGVDIEAQPQYPYTFVQMCAVEFLRTQDISQYDFIHASPPCLAHTLANATAKKKGKRYEDFIDIIRELLIASGKPYCIENVPNAGLKNAVRLQGAHFGLPIIRKRDFECNFFLLCPASINQKNEVMQGKSVTVAGNAYQNGSPFKGKLKGMENLTMLQTRKLAMQIPWASNKKQVNNAIPPLYTKYIFEMFLQQSKPK
jgi:DNA (cytosine-5)-methyltransferase 1